MKLDLNPQISRMRRSKHISSAAYERCKRQAESFDEARLATLKPEAINTYHLSEEKFYGLKSKLESYCSEQNSSIRKFCAKDASDEKALRDYTVLALGEAADQVKHVENAAGDRDREAKKISRPDPVQSAEVVVTTHIQFDYCVPIRKASFTPDGCSSSEDDYLCRKGDSPQCVHGFAAVQKYCKPGYDGSPRALDNLHNCDGYNGD